MARHRMLAQVTGQADQSLPQLGRLPDDLFDFRSFAIRPARPNIGLAMLGQISFDRPSEVSLECVLRELLGCQTRRVFRIQRFSTLDDLTKAVVRLETETGSNTRREIDAPPIRRMS